MKRNQSPILVTVSIAVALWLGASTAVAATSDNLATVDYGPEIDRNATDLRDELMPRDLDRDIADTALVFTNLRRNPSAVRCIAFDGDGEPIGRAWLRVPALGVRYLLASDLVNGTDFVGQVQCGARAHLQGTAVFLGAGVTDLPALQPKHRGGRIRFPLVATY